MYNKIQYLNYIFVMHVNGSWPLRAKNHNTKSKNDFCGAPTKKDPPFVSHEQGS